MAKYAGLWIDHKRAYIVTIEGGREEAREVLSNAEGRPRYHARARVQEGVAENQRDRRIAGQLERFYDQVTALVRDAEAILIIGPGEAKGEMADNLSRAGLASHIVATEAAARLTDRQIAARVRKTFAA